MDAGKILRRLINKLEGKRNRAAMVFLEEGHVDALRGLFVNNLQCLEALNMIAI